MDSLTRDSTLPFSFLTLFSKGVSSQREEFAPPIRPNFERAAWSRKANRKSQKFFSLCKNDRIMEVYSYTLLSHSIYFRLTITDHHQISGAILGVILEICIRFSTLQQNGKYSPVSSKYQRKVECLHIKFVFRTGPEVINKCSCSTQLSMKFFMLKNIKMPTIVSILTFMSRKNSILGLSEPKKSRSLSYFHRYEHLKFRAQLS